MAEYLYTRILDSVTNLYDIDYNGEVSRLGNEIQTDLPSLTSIKVVCNGTEVKIIVEPTLSGGDKTTLDNTVSNHT